MTAPSSNLKIFWRRLSTLDVVAFAFVAAGASALVLGLRGGLYGFVKFIAVCAAVYLLYRLIGWGRNKLLWSLRSRLVVAYLFIAVVPIVLILVGAVLSAKLLYSQFGAYLFYEDIHNRIEMIRD